MSEDAVAQQRDAFVGRLLEYTGGALNLFAIYIGDRLGFYRALAEGGPSTAAELAARTSTEARYVREWLVQQTVAGIVEVEDERCEAPWRRLPLSRFRDGSREIHECASH